MTGYQPKTGDRCTCRPGVQRDNCPECEGTGWRIDFAKIRARHKPDIDADFIGLANGKLMQGPVFERQAGESAAEFVARVEAAAAEAEDAP